ncbi:hypothetical protein FDI21_gp238 [Pseudomonas phage Noxifer]|uniref:Virion structural protein n=1 Tax=Pseudomonas phage Noxifer TaxID=2006684 RepID=A0A1Y0T0B4_9CAUD|nr:hypothetical protein FDI21_gp238 [Pseudomonas phage Noxifer]ARV77473.1 hypothetical protein NOXIFER_308 [Pseudomonas phage Noxifer]
MSNQEQEPNSVELTAGEVNSNWNLRDKLQVIEDYQTALKKGFIGSEEDWMDFLREIEELAPELPEPTPESATAPLDEAPQPALPPVPEVTMRLISHKAAKKAKRYRSGPFVRLVLWLTAFFLMTITIVGLVGYDVYTKNVVRERIDRPVPCSLNKEGIEITGTRNYSYIDNRFAGYHWSNDETLLERTTLNVSMNGLTIVAITDGESKTIRRGQAEGGILILPKADYYTFFINGKATGASYGDLCK